MVGRDRDTADAIGHNADSFAAFFVRKVDDVRANTASASQPVVDDTACSLLTSFQPCTATEIRRIIMSLPVKSCSLDPMPIFLLREMLDVLTPFVTSLVNASLSQCRLPDSQKHAIVSPLLKKPAWTRPTWPTFDQCRIYRFCRKSQRE